MTLVGQPERATQNRVVALFRDELGYRYIGDWADRDGNSNIEEGLLSAWLARSGYTPAQISVALRCKWGSCNHETRTIRLNSELAKKPAECLEYIVFHELVHLLEPTHNARFVALMDRFMPKWQFHRQILNRLPVRHEKWSH